MAVQSPHDKSIHACTQYLHACHLAFAVKCLGGESKSGESKNDNWIYNPIQDPTS